MPDDESINLRPLFEKHRLDRDSARAASEAKLTGEAQRADQCRIVLREIVFPLMLESVEQIKTAGHSASALEAISGTEPSVKLSFTPTGGKRYPESVLVFVCEGRKVSALFEVMKNTGSVDAPIGAVTRKWTSKVISDFVEGVLKEGARRA
jgi:hypothetical protein